MKTRIAGFEIHPAANLFPMMTDDEFAELKADIKKHGQIIPIVLYRDLILDGRNRALACDELGLNLKVQNRDEIDDPISWAISANAKRRNLTKGQLAAVAADSLPLYEAEAKERKKEMEGRPSKLEEKIPQESREPQARDKAAAATGVNPRYVQDAKKIKEESPETFEKLKTGETTIQQAKRDLSIGREWEKKGVHKPVDHSPEDDEPDQLWELKRLWRKTPKKQQTLFKKWINEQK